MQKGFNPKEQSLEGTRLLLLQHADKTVMSLKGATGMARKGYKDALEALKVSNQHLERQENVLNHAVIAYAYYQITLTDDALNRGADTFRIKPPHRVPGSQTDVVYRSSMILLLLPF